jgi:Spy/CpxP family protein refolding chaperone
MRRLGLLAALLGTWAVAVAFAQPPFAWWENPIANGLTLSEAQRDKIGQIMGEHRDRLTRERQEAERAEREFESVINADTVDWGRGRIAIDQWVKARGVFTEDMARMTLRLRNVLTAEQWHSLQLRDGGRGREGGKGRPPDERGRRGPASGPAH